LGWCRRTNARPTTSKHIYAYSCIDMLIYEPFP
jgi:hypothetical protein